jgi:Xaa-Pro aminopeptidase
MQTMHPTLLIGPGDWDPQQISREEYDARLAALWRDHENAGGAIVYGDSRNHAALAYLTHFTPKLEAAMALIPRRGEPQMLIGGGINMLPAARPLTFVSTLAPLRDAAKSIGDLAKGLGSGMGLVLLGGEAIPNSLRSALDEALGVGSPVENGDAALQARMRQKSAREVQMLRESAVTLAGAVTALRDAVHQDKNVTDCILVAEHVALQRGAQDVRSLFSLDGGRTLRPFDVPVAQSCDPLQAYLAVRHGGYWAEAFVRVATRDDALQRETDNILRTMVAEAKPGRSGRQLRQIGDACRGAFRIHPLADQLFGGSIGLTLDEPPLLTPESEITLEKNAVYSLRAGLIDEAGAGALVSAMVLVTGGGSEVLWPINGSP